MSIGENPSTLVCPAFDELPGCCFPPPSGKSLTFVPPPDGAPGIVGFDELELETTGEPAAPELVAAEDVVLFGTVAGETV